MSNTLLATLAAYVPTPVAYQIANAPQLILQPQSRRSEAAVVFVDLCGFTALADQLRQAGASGASELTQILNSYFERMITLLELYGGQVTKFSGDALVVLFPCTTPSTIGTGDIDCASEALAAATLRAVQAAQTMRTAMAAFTGSLTALGRAGLNLKVSIAAGEVLAMQVGGVFGRWEYVIAGDAMVQLAIAAHHTAPGQVILSGAAYALVSGQLEATPTATNCWQVHAAPPAVPAPLQPIDWTTLPGQSYPTAEAALRAYIPAAVTNQLDEGGWIAELRPMSMVFAGIGGLDYSAPDAARWLHRFVTAAQDAVYRYEGALNKVAVDDKGTVLLALFGAPPLVHADDPARALACAHDLQQIARTQQLRMAIGITTGTVFSGTVGALGRREYTVIGDPVNMAARLMQIAGAGNTLCDEPTARATDATWPSDALPAVRLKGKPHPVPVYRPQSPLLARTATLTDPFFGRQVELMELLQELGAVQGGGSRLVLLSGAAGSGKTRLVQELRYLSQHCELLVLMSHVQLDPRTPVYTAWRDLLGSAFNVQTMVYGVRRMQVIADRVFALYPQFQERLPLLNDIQALGLPESTFSAGLNASQRHNELAALLSEILRDRANNRPLMLVLEDMHDADPRSWQLLLDVARQFTGQPLLILLTTQHITALEPLETLRAHMPHREIALGGLHTNDVAALLAHYLDIERVPDDLVAEYLERTGGNPAQIEHLLSQHQAHRHEQQLARSASA